MHEFKDTEGRTWQLRMDLGKAMAIDEQHGINVLAGDQPDGDWPNVATRLVADPIAAAKCILTIIAEQIEERSLTEKDVRAAFDGPTLLAAQEAFRDEMAGFFLGLGRTDIAEMIELEREATKLLRTGNHERLAASRQTLGTPSGTSPEPSAA